MPSTTEPFRQWILNDQFGVVDQDLLMVPKGTAGIAIAIYETGDQVVVRPDVHGTETGPVLIIGGVRVDGGGVVITGGKPHPVAPWGPLIARLVKGVAVMLQAEGGDERFTNKVRQAAAEDALTAIKAASAALQKFKR